MDLKDIVIYSDMDGTMLTDWDRGPYVPKRNIEGIAGLINEGGAFSIASGRQHRDTTCFFPKGFFNAPSVHANGALIYDCRKDSILRARPIPQGCKEELVEYARYRKDLWLVVADEDRIYELLYCDERDRMRTDTIRGYLEIEEFYSRDFMKACYILPDPEYMPTMEADFCRMACSATLNYSQSSPIFFECYAKGVDKGSGVRTAMELAGITGKKLVCFGDYFNDLPMFGIADICACPDNAPDEIKAICQIVTCSNNDGAVGDLIEQLRRL